MGQELNETWGRKLHQVRTERDISVLKLSREAEVSPAYIYMLEAGQYSPSDEVRLRIATALDVQVEDIWSYQVAS